VRFGVQASHARGDAELKEMHNKNFTGVPIPAAAAASVSAVLLLYSDNFKSLVNISDEARAWILTAMMIILGYFMVSRWKFPSLKKLHVRVASFQVVFLTVLGAVFFFYGVLNFFPVVFFVFSWMYLIVSWVLSIIRIISGRKSKTLEDFEPDPDEFEE
jgi:CDP-diacylglycerol--serine O-phosphatidyltransferase